MKIAIVGAGITGSLLANKLASGGHSPVVFEKSRGRGGRCTFKRTDWAEFDLGAPVVPAWENNFIKFMQTQVDSGLATSWPKQVFEFDGQLATAATKRQQYVFTGGMNATCVSWLQNLPLISECRIEQASRTAGKWWLTDSLARHHGPFDSLVVTAPWPQTEQLLRKIAGINQSLPEQDWSSCWTVAMQLTQSIATHVELIYLKNTPVQTLIRDSAKPDRKSSQQQLWIAHFDHHISAQLGEEGASEAMLLAGQVLQQVFPDADLQFANHYCHFWRYARPAQKQAAIGLIIDKQQNIFAGGDWSYGASIQAAWQAANKLCEGILSNS
jgi:renalase